MDPRHSQITKLLQASDPESKEELLALIYGELQGQARACLAREKPGQTLQPTALVHEVFLRLSEGEKRGPRWDGRRHYFAAAAKAMRQILINQARRKARLRHGGAHERVDMDAIDVAFEDPITDVLAVEEALEQLQAVDPRAREIVDLRYYAGLTIPETADILGVSVSTVDREWRFLRTFLQEALAQEGQE